MSVIVLMLLALLAGLNYRACRDFRYPPVLMSALWLFAMTLYYVSPLKINSIGILTALVFVSTIIAFSGGAFLTLALAENSHRGHFSQSTSLAFPSMRPQLKKLLLALSVAFLPLMVEKAIELVSQSGSEIFFVGLRSELLAEGSSGWGHLGNAYLLSWFTTFVYAIEPRTSRREKVEYYISQALSFAYAFLTTGRTSILLVLAVLTGIYLMQGKFRVRTFILCVVVFLISFAFLGVALLKGGDPDTSVTENVSSIGDSLLTYAEGPIAAFDQVVRKDAPLEYGKNMFIGPLNMFRRWTGKAILSPIQEEVDVPFPTNVYTGIQPVYKDFGVIGVVITFAVLGAAWTCFYLKGLAGDRLSVFCYSLSLFPLFFMTFSDQCFAPMITWAMLGCAAYLYFRTGNGKRASAYSQAAEDYR